MSGLKIAIVHDWMTGMREREGVLLSLAAIFHDADLFTLMYHPASMDASFRDRRVVSSTLQGMHWGRTGYKRFLPFYWELMGGFDLSSYDLVVSSSTAIAKWVRVPKKAMHVCYCHTPMKWIWDKDDQGLGFPGAGLFRPYLRKCDLKSNEGVAHFVAPSEEVRTRIKTLYGRESEVFAPPADVGAAKFEFRMQVHFRKLFGIKSIGEN